MEKFSNCFEFELLLSRCSLFKLHVYCADDRRYGQRRCEIDYEGTLNWPLNKRFSLHAKKKTSHYIMHEAMEEDDHHYSEYLLAVWRFEVSACDIWQRRRGRSRCFYSHSIAKISKNARHFVCLVFFSFIVIPTSSFSRLHNKSAAFSVCTVSNQKHQIMQSFFVSNVTGEFSHLRIFQLNFPDNHRARLAPTRGA